MLSCADDLQILDDAGIGLWRFHVPSGSAASNSAFHRLIGSTPAKSATKAEFSEWIERVLDADQLQLLARHQELVRGDVDAYQMDFRTQRVDGSLSHLRVHARVSERSATGEPLHLLLVLLDVSREHDLARARDALRGALEQLAVAARFESVGQLAAGLAHEINTPVQYVSDSVYFIRDVVRDLLDYCAQWPPSTDAGQKFDMEYIREQLPEAVKASVEGLDRVAEIVRSMQEFSCADRRETGPVDLNRTIQSALVVARKEYKDVAELETHYGNLPPVICHSGDISQVIVNLVTNAAQAISDTLKGAEGKGRITVTSRRTADEVIVSVADTGGGIPEAVRSRVFDPFFTTKEIGRGMGLGLSISRNIARKHHGSLTFETSAQSGTTFFLRLPLGSKDATSLPSAATV